MGKSAFIRLVWFLLRYSNPTELCINESHHVDINKEIWNKLAHDAYEKKQRAELGFTNFSVRHTTTDFTIACLYLS